MLFIPAYSIQRVIPEGKHNHNRDFPMTRLFGLFHDRLSDGMMPQALSASSPRQCERPSCSVQVACYQPFPRSTSHSFLTYRATYRHFGNCASCEILDTTYISFFTTCKLGIIKYRKHVGRPSAPGTGIQE